MPTVKPVVTLVIDELTLQRIEEFRFNARFSSRSAAILYIIRAGMIALQDQYPELNPNTKIETGKKQRPAVTQLKDDTGV